MITLPQIGPGFQSHRVVISADGEAVGSKRAREQYGINPAIIFHRNDGWMLGAPAAFEDVAFSLWSDKWTHFVRKPSTTWVPIEQY